MCLGAESFTLLAILEAQDRASAIVERVDEAYQRFTDTTDKAAVSAEAAGDAIDESLLKTASGADALELANDRVAAAQARLTTAEQAQAAAERELRDAAAAAASAADGDAAAMDRQILAASTLEKAEADTAVATKALSDAQSTQARTAEAAAAKSDAAATSTKKAGDAGKDAGTGMLGMSAGMSKVVVGSAAVAAGVGIVAAASTKMAADFQDSTTHLVTDAGETQSQLASVQSGILRIAGQTGTTADALSAAMYHIESAGYHGAAGLQLLQTAAEGAKVGGADFDVVAKTLTGTMNAYNMQGGQAVSMMNQLIATVGAGDMNMQDLASSLGNVAPLAAAAGIQFSQVGGAIATMTAQNMSAQQATQDLANTIRSLQAPNNVAIQEMQAMGLNANDVSQNLGKRGLTGTLEMLTQAVASHVKGGQVLIDTFQASKTAASDANTMIGSMPGNLQKLARSYLDGSVTAKQWSADLKGMPPIQAHLMSQFATLADKTHSFNTLLAGGSPAAQTFNQAMEKMMGGATGLNTALMLTGGRMATFQDNANTVADAARKGGNTVDNWSTIQSTFNQKMSEAKAGAQAAGIALGMALLPAVTAVLNAVVHILTPLGDWISGHQTLAAIILGSLGGIAALTTMVLLVSAAFSKVVSAGKIVGQALGLIKIQSAQTAAASESSAARVSAGWLLNGVKMIGQAIAQGAVWVATNVAQFVSVAASAAASGASTAAAWVASSATTLATTIAKGAVWVATWVAQTATVMAANIASAVASAAAWVAANIAMIAATGGIILLLGAVVAAAIWLGTHWSEVWSGIKQVAGNVWHWIENNVIQPLVSVWDNYVLPPLRFLGQIWDDVWNGIKSVVQDVWGFLKPIFDAIGSAVSAVSNAIGGVVHTIGSIGSGIGHLLGFDEGGWVPGSPGQPRLAVVHGGEYVLSQDMLSGGKLPDIALSGERGSGIGGLSLGGGGGTVNQVTVIVQGNTVMGDKDVQTLVNKIGRQVATKILPSAGVRIAM